MMILLICFGYLIIQCAYITYAAFSIDDFWLAYHTYQYKKALPYRDFAPYKSVLGYYIFLLPMTLFHGVLTPLFYTKLWITLINTIALGGAFFWLKKFFSPSAILTGIILIVCSPIFILYSSEIRVDLLAYWCCLISVLFIFDKKYFLAGVSISVGFLISQKSAWYIIATNCALVGQLCFYDRSWNMIKKIMSFDLGALLILLLYITFWAYSSNLNTVLTSLFYEPYLISSTNWYAKFKLAYWLHTIIDNFGIVLISSISLIGLIILPLKNKLFIIIYILVSLFFVISCKAPFLYHPLAALPAFIVLFSAFFTTLYSSLHLSKKFSQHDWILFIFMLILLGIFLPVFRLMSIVPENNGNYQKSMIHLMTHLLHDGEHYIAGVPLFLDIEQSIPGLVHLIAPSIEYISHPSAALYPIVSSRSMYLTPVTIPDLIQSIDKAPIKLYVDNNRFHYLPKMFKRYLNTQYQHYWGSIYLYAPQIQANHQIIYIKFPGNYQIKASELISLDKHKIQPNTIIHLNQQSYVSDSHSTYRLKLIPDSCENDLKPEFKKNHWNWTLI